MEIVLQNVGKQFKNGTSALDHVSFTVPQGEFVSVIGPSGAGKTTLFRILNGMETPGDGTVLFDGSDISSMSGTARKNVKRSIGTIYQDFSWKIPPALQMCSLPVYRIWDFSPLCSESTEKSAGQKH